MVNIMEGARIDLFKPELVFLDLEVGDRCDLFRQLGSALASLGYIEDTWYEAIVGREQDFPTGLQFEAVAVALPHVDPVHLKKPYIAVVRPRTPVVFEGMAGIGGDVSAELIVNLGLTGHAEGQVAVLQALMNVFLDAAAVADIMAQTTPEGVSAAMRRYCG